MPVVTAAYNSSIILDNIGRFVGQVGPGYVDGTGFVAGCVLRVNGIIASNFVFGGPTWLSFDFPNLPIGTVATVSVTNPDLTVGVLPQGFLYCGNFMIMSTGPHNLTPLGGANWQTPTGPAPWWGLLQNGNGTCDYAFLNTLSLNGGAEIPWSSLPAGFFPAAIGISSAAGSIGPPTSGSLEVSVPSVPLAFAVTTPSDATYHTFPAPTTIGLNSILGSTVFITAHGGTSSSSTKRPAFYGTGADGITPNGQFPTVYIYGYYSLLLTTVTGFSQSGDTLTITGTGFLPSQTIAIAANGVPVPLTDIFVSPDGTTITIHFPPLPPGTVITGTVAGVTIPFPNPTPPVPPPTPAPTGCAPCTTLTMALAQLSLRLQDAGFVHWTAAELTRYLTEALRTWNALTEEFMGQASFPSVLGQPFYDLPTLMPALRAFTVTDTYMVADLEYALMEPPTGGAWTGTPQFTFPDIVSALQQRRDQFLLETGMVVNRVVQALPVPPASGRIPLNPEIMTIRRLAYVNPTGVVFPLQRDDEWASTAFNRGWTGTSGVPGTNPTHPLVYSVGVSPPLIVQILPPLSTAGSLDIIAVTRSGVMGSLGPCLDPAVGVFLGVPDDWTWVVKWGALATLLKQDGVTFDPQRAAYCEARYRHGIQLAIGSAVTLQAKINGGVVPINSLSDADQYSRAWQSYMAAPTSVLLTGQNLVGLAQLPIDATATVTLDVVRNMPIPAIGTDCLLVEDAALDAILGYAQHLATFKEGPTQLLQSQDLLDKFFRMAGVTIAIDKASVPNRTQINTGQSTQDEREHLRMTTPPPETNLSSQNQRGSTA